MARKNGGKGTWFGNLGRKVRRFEPTMASGRLAYLELVRINAWGKAIKIANLQFRAAKNDPKAVKVLNELVNIWEEIGGDKKHLLDAAAKGKNKKIPHIVVRKNAKTGKLELDEKKSDMAELSTIPKSADGDYFNAVWIIPAIGVASAIIAKMATAMNKDSESAIEMDEAQKKAIDETAKKQEAKQKSDNTKLYIIGGVTLVVVAGLTWWGISSYLKKHKK